MKPIAIAVLVAFSLMAGRAIGAEPDPAAQAQKKKIVFIAGTPSHGFGAHEHNAGCLLLSKYLNDNVPSVHAVVTLNGWPKDESILDGASAIVIYCDGGGGHLALPHLAELDAMNEKGVGIGCIHYAVEVPKDKGGPEFLKWMGGYFEAFYSINPHWTASFTEIPKHPVTNGVRPFATNDEWYYHMRFRDNMEGVTPILSAVPPDSTRQGKDDAHGGNQFVRADIGKNVKETVVWVSENKNGSRGFGCTGGHVHWNWAQDDFRKTILNSIVWIAHVDVPDGGVPSKAPVVDELLANQDEAVPANFEKEKQQKQLDELNQPKAVKP